jgi:chaperonin GroES
MHTKNNNSSGIWPVGYRVLVKPDRIEEKTEGGIIIPAPDRGRHEQAGETGVLIAIGLDCWKEYEKAWAKPGDRVLFAQHQGQELTGKDGETYRLLNDVQIGAFLEDGVNLTQFKARKSYD